MDKLHAQRRETSSYFFEYVAVLGVALFALTWVTAINTLDISWGELARYAQTVWRGVFPPG